MAETYAEPLYRSHTLDTNLSGGKKVASSVAAVLLAILFLVSGCWKLTDPYRWSQMLYEFQVPSAVALPFAVLLGMGETLGALLILLPRTRRWGAWLLGALLVAFMGYIGLKYNVLVGKECSCFPIVKRTIGPGFFVGDAVMLAMVVIAGVWARRAVGLRPAVLALAAVCVLAGAGFAIDASKQTGIKAPSPITVDGQPFSLSHGNIFLFFYDPECMHCDAAARRMAKLNWGQTTVIGIPTRVPQFAASFLHDTHLKARTTNDVAKLRGAFNFVDPPYGVALENGRAKAMIATWDDSEPVKTLKPLGFVQ